MVGTILLNHFSQFCVVVWECLLLQGYSGRSLGESFAQPDHACVGRHTSGGLDDRKHHDESHPEGGESDGQRGVSCPCDCCHTRNQTEKHRLVWKAGVSAEEDHLSRDQILVVSAV